MSYREASVWSKLLLTDIKLSFNWAKPEIEILGGFSKGEFFFQRVENLIDYTTTGIGDSSVTDVKTHPELFLVYKVRTKKMGELIVGIIGGLLWKEEFVPHATELCKIVDVMCPRRSWFGTKSHSEIIDPISSLLRVDNKFRQTLKATKTKYDAYWVQGFGNPRSRIWGDVFTEILPFKSSTIISTSAIPKPEKWRRTKYRDGKKYKHLGFRIQPSIINLIPRIEYYLKQVSWQGECEGHKAGRAISHYAAAYQISEDESSCGKFKSTSNWYGFTFDPSFNWKVDKAEGDPNGDGLLRITSSKPGRNAGIALEWYRDPSRADKVFSSALNDYFSGSKVIKQKAQDMELNGHAVKHVQVYDMRKRNGKRLYNTASLMRFDCDKTKRHVFGLVFVISDEEKEAKQTHDILWDSFLCH